MVIFIPLNTVRYCYTYYFAVSIMCRCSSYVGIYTYLCLLIVCGGLGEFCDYYRDSSSFVYCFIDGLYIYTYVILCNLTEEKGGLSQLYTAKSVRVYRALIAIYGSVIVLTCSIRLCWETWNLNTYNTFIVELSVIMSWLWLMMKPKTLIIL